MHHLYLTFYSQAGCIVGKDSKKLIIALEPEAASLCCRRMSLAQYGDKKGISFPKGTKYLILDCGGTSSINDKLNLN